VNRKDTTEIDTEQPQQTNYRSTYPGHSAGLQGWVPLPLHIACAVGRVKADRRGPKGHTGLAGWGLEG